MDFKTIRIKHPAFTFESFKYEVDGKNLKIKFHFHTDPDIDYYPETRIPLENIEIGNLDSFIFNLGLIEMISYWKATCSPEIIVKAGKLTETQVNWWRDLLINGLGEFFYQNQIDFLDTGFLEIKSNSDREFSISDKKSSNGDLILIGGGKDSAVTAELLQELKGRKNALLVNPTPAATNTTKVAGFPNSIVVTRLIDQRLLALNDQGYLNGHTPFSAYLSFLSILVARLHGFKNVVVSNEKSAGEASLNYLGMEINHQYSKSFVYEKKFREYASHHLSNKINYFSFLRPLNEIQIAALFIQTDKYDKAFNSCNVGRNEYWCGECAKCAFVYLIFSALLPESRLKNIFGDKDFMKNPKIKKHVKDLIGDGIHKPLDCVGTEEESRMAVRLRKNQKDARQLARIKNDWSNEHFLPKEYEMVLKNKMEML